MKIKLNVVFILAAIPLVFMGIGMTFATSAMIESFGLDSSPAAIHFGRATAAAFIGIGVMIFLARNAGPSQARNAMVAGLSLFFFLAVIVEVRAIMAGTYGAESWFTGVLPWFIFLVLTVLAGRNAMAQESKEN